MESAVFGLIGVIVGGLLSIAKDWWLEKLSRAKNAEYLVIQISCALEQYALRCADVVNDDGLSYGQRDKDGCCRVQVTPPEFEPKTFDVEWKSLPVDLMDEILYFPYKAKLAAQHIAAVEKYEAGPPDYEEFFEERQRQYATLGIAAWELAGKLRKHKELPQRSAKITGDWDPINDMERRKSEIDSQRSMSTITPQC